MPKNLLIFSKSHVLVGMQKEVWQRHTGLSICESQFWKHHFLSNLQKREIVEKACTFFSLHGCPVPISNISSRLLSLYKHSTFEAKEQVFSDRERFYAHHNHGSQGKNNICLHWGTVLRLALSAQPSSALFINVYKVFQLSTVTSPLPKNNNNNNKKKPKFRIRDVSGAVSDTKLIVQIWTS